MNGLHQDPERIRAGRGKVLYLLSVTAVIFVLPAVVAERWERWLGVGVLLALQIMMLLRGRVAVPVVLRPVVRLKWLFVFLLGFYTVLPPDTPEAGDWIRAFPVPFVHWTLALNLSGLDRAGLMCLQIVALLLASAAVRLSGDGRDLVVGLESFRLPPLFVYALDHTLELLGGIRDRPPGGGRGSGKRRTGNQNQETSGPGFRGIMRQVLRGDVGFFVQIIKDNIDRASTLSATGRPLDAGLARDVAVVTGIALCMASLKFIKILPGIPFASGYKLVLLFPLYILAARLTRSRWGATAVGSIMGVIGFLQGDGRLGLLEVLKHITPGIVIDLCDPLARRLPRWAFGYCLLGLVAAIARTTTEFALVLLLGARAEVYIFPAAKLIPNLLAGFLSGFVTMVVLRPFERMIVQYDAPLATPSSALTEALPKTDSESLPSRRGAGTRAGGGRGAGTGGGRGRTSEAGKEP